MQSDRSRGGSTRSGKSRRTADPAFLDPARAAVGHRARRHARFEGNRELQLHALRAEVSALRAQLGESLVREAQARTLACTDSLTRLSNRAAFLEQLSQALSGDDPRFRRLAVLFDAAMYRAKRRRTGCEFFSSNRPRAATSAETADSPWIFGAEGCLP